MAGHNEVPIEIALKALQHAKERREPWFTVARAVRSLIREGGTDLPAQVSAAKRPTYSPRLLVRAADASGYSPNLLARFVLVLEFVERLAAAGLVTIEAVQGASFVSLECLKRIWTIDPEMVRDLLPKVLRGGVNVRDLRAETQRMTDPRVRARRLKTPEEWQMLARVLKEELPSLSGSPTGHFVRVTRKLGPFVGADFLIIGERDGRVESVDAIEAKAMSTFASAGAVEDAISRTALRSTFFSRYWLILGDARKSVLARFAWAIDVLSLKNVGIGELDSAAESLKVLIRPSPVPPLPDRREEIIEALRTRQWDQL
jgi:hypothetical protein